MNQQDLNNTIATTPDYFLSLSDYLYQQKGKAPEKVPFFITVIDDENNPVPIGTGNDNEVIMGLKLTINPTTTSLNMARIINKTQTMVGWIEEHWGEELDSLTLQGSTAGFILGGRNMREISNGYYLNNIQIDRTQGLNQALNLVDLPSAVGGDRGLTTARRRETVSYQEFKKIIGIMNSNGMVFDSQGFVKQRRYIQIAYDIAAYKGYIESIDTVEDANSPYRFQYTITFKSEQTLFSFI